MFTPMKKLFLDDIRTVDMVYAAEKVEWGDPCTDRQGSIILHNISIRYSGLL